MCGTETVSPVVSLYGAALNDDQFAGWGLPSVLIYSPAALLIVVPVPVGLRRSSEASEGFDSLFTPYTTGTLK